MSVFGGILLFVAGVTTGGGALIYNQKCVQKQTAQLRRENEHLKESAWWDRLDFETNRAYRKGYRDGRKSPANDAEQFVELIEKRNIDFRGPRRRDRHEKAAE